MLKNFKIEIYILIVLFVGLFVSYNLDIGLYNYFSDFNNSLQNVFLKKFFIQITTLGDSIWYFSFSIIFGFVLLFIKNKKIYSSSPKVFVRLFFINILLFISVLVSGILAQILKHLIGRPRPNTMVAEDQIAINFFSFDSGYHSFPSGHATTIFAVALVLVFSLPKLKYFFYFLASVVAFSRVVVGAHYITDIIAGVCVAFIGFKLALYILKKFANIDLKEGRAKDLNNNLFVSFVCLVLLSIFLLIGPSFDIFFSGLFYLGEGQFVNQSYYIFTIFFRKIVLNLILVYILILPIVTMFLPINQIFFGYKFKTKEVFFIWVTMFLNLVVFVNLVLKNLWGRARPNEILELGGRDVFSPWYLVSDQCGSNCSFVSGDASVGFSLIVLFFIIKKEIFLKLSLFFGVVLGLVRISEGGHFLSDVIMSCFVVFSFTLLAYLYYSRKFND